MDLADIIARECIRDLVARYNTLGDAGRTDEVGALFAPDGVLEVGDRDRRTRATGPTAIAELLGSVKKQWAGEAGANALPGYVRHATSTLLIELLGPGHARASCYVWVVRAQGLVSWGRYFDTYAEQPGGRWLFASRKALADSVSLAAGTIDSAPAGTQHATAAGHPAASALE